MEDQLTLYGHSFSSRLILGTARYESPMQLADAIRRANPAMLTVSLRRQLPGKKEAGQAFWNLLRETGKTILPNTAGCHSVHEAVTTACMARELFETNLLKLEVIGDEMNLQPDPFALVDATVELIKLGFQVFPYCTEDWSCAAASWTPVARSLCRGPLPSIRDVVIAVHSCIDPCSKIAAPHQQNYRHKTSVEPHRRSDLGDWPSARECRERCISRLDRKC
jgi:hypothetical protein